MGEISLRLIIIVIGHKVLHGIIRKEFAKFRAELRRQSLVMRQHQGRPLHAFYDLRHCVCLSGTGHAKKRLLVQAVRQPFSQSVYGLGLVSGGPIFAYNLKLRHNFLHFQYYMDSTILRAN